jgi:hypothetical protein
MIETTLNRIRAHEPCIVGWKKLLKHLRKVQADDEPLAMTVILDSNGLYDVLWCLRVEPQHSAIWRLLAVHYARQVQHLMSDPRSLDALYVAERHAHGLATDEQLRNARVAARVAAWNPAWAAALPAPWEVAWAAALPATWEAAWAAARDAAWAAARDAAWGTAWDAARAQQSKDLRVVLTHYHARPGQAIHGWEGMNHD